MQFASRNVCRTIASPIESSGSSQIQLVPSRPATAPCGRARSRADFIYKLGNTIEETDESALWLEILAEAELCPRSATDPLWQEADELVRILVRSGETARANRRPARRK